MGRRRTDNSRREEGKAHENDERRKQKREGESTGVNRSNESTVAVRQLVRPDDGSLTRFPKEGDGRFA